MTKENSLEAVFLDGVRKHQAGFLAQAGHCYAQVLAANPRHADALHLSGVLALQAGDHTKAAGLIAQAIGLKDSVAAYHVNLGLAQEKLGKSDEALSSYRRAIVLQRNFAEAHNNLGNLLEERGELNAAEASLRTALALKPDYLEAHNNLGVVLTRQGRAEEAIAALQRALEIGGDYAPAFDNLGAAFRDLGRFDEAAKAHEQALALGADPASSFYGLSACRRFTDADADVIAQMQAELARPELSDTARSLLHFALGKIADDRGQYEAAMAHFDAGNALEQKQRRFDASRFSGRVDEVIAAFADARPSAQASDSNMPILIVGMPRSGTTLVEQILASHSAVAAGGELNFWSQAFAETGDSAASDAAFAAGYLSLLAKIGAGKARVTDKLPNNFLYLGQVHRLFPNARILHCRRDPLDTALSLYCSRFTRGQDFAFRRADIVSCYRDYRRLMAHWRKILPPDRLLDVDYEALTASPETAIRQMLEFCGLLWEENCLAFHNRGRTVRTLSAWQVRQPLYRSSIGRWRNYAPWLGELRALAEL